MFSDAFLSLLGGLAASAACYSIGALLLDRLKIDLHPQERAALGFVLGAACFHLVIFAVLSAHVGYRAVLIGLPFLAIVIGIGQGVFNPKGKSFEPLNPTLKWFSIALFGTFSVL